VTKVTIPAKSLRRVIQEAKDLHTRNVAVSINRNIVTFELLGDDGARRVIKLESIRKEG